MDLRKLEDIDIEGKSVFLRLDLNVPLKGGVIQDDTRIQKALPTVKYLLERTNKIAIASHLGRPKGKVNQEMSLEPVGNKLAELLEKEVVFVADYTEEPVDQVIAQLNKEQFVLLENTRFHEGETKNDLEFSKHLIKGFDFYVNDAFGTVHRAHSSTVGAAELLPAEKRAAGLLIGKELDALGGVMTSPDHPFTVIMGGAKVSDKIPVILNLITKCNSILIGGAMAYTFLKYKGVDVGASKVEEESMGLVKSIFEAAEARKVTIHIPEDHVCAKEFKEDAAAESVRNPDIPAGLMALDIGEKTAKKYADIIKKSKTVLWNGPMGVFEWQPFSHGSIAVANAMAESSGQTIIGGGDSVSAVNKAGVADKMTHISTGGGASLELLEGKTLPGLKVLAK